jgi:2-polyprenyl-6-methoxyphenol hydroxylase-like FAD-dependent oxidoreductase
MALVGDAAHRVHPLAGQGLNLGLSDVAYLSNAVIAAKKSGLDIGDLDGVLIAYDKQSKMNAYMIMGAIEFVKRSYDPTVQGNDALGHVLAVARNLGIDLIESSDLMKFNFM